jgi:hypothetical protein
MRIGDFSLFITGGQEQAAGHVALSHGQVYGLQLTKHGARRCDAVVNVDGKEIGTWRLAAGQSAMLTRPATDHGQFTFYRADSAEAQAAQLGNVGRDNLGLVQVRFVPEMAHAVNTVWCETTYRSKGGGGVLRGMPESSGAYGAGGTGLSGHSNQEYGNATPIMRDEGAAVTISVRLVEQKAVSASPPAVRPLQPIGTSNPVPPPVE